MMYMENMSCAVEKTMDIVTITDRISYLPGRENPLS